MADWSPGDQVEAKDQSSGKWTSAKIKSAPNGSSCWVEFLSSGVSQKTQLAHVRAAPGSRAAAELDEDAEVKRLSLLMKSPRPAAPPPSSPPEAATLGGDTFSLNLKGVGDRQQQQLLDAPKSPSSFSVVISPRPISMTPIDDVDDDDQQQQQQQHEQIQVHISPRPLSVQVVTEDPEIETEVEAMRARLMALKEQIQRADAEAAQWERQAKEKDEEYKRDQERGRMLREKISEQHRLVKKARIRPALPPPSRSEELQELKRKLEEETRLADAQEKSQRRSSWIAPAGLMSEISAYQQKLADEQSKQAELQSQLDTSNTRIDEARAEIARLESTAPHADQQESDDVVYYRKQFSEVNAALERELERVAALKKQLDEDLATMSGQLQSVEAGYEQEITELKAQLEELRV